MRLQAFIINEDRTQSIQKEEAIGLIKKNCMKHVKGLKNGSRATIYRGTWSNIRTGYGVLDPRKGTPRESANTSNHMTLLMDNLPSWKKFPLRSRSVICSTDKRTAYNFGDRYYVYPYDKCIFGTAPAGDVWGAFEALGVDSVDEFNAFLTRTGAPSVSDKSYSALKDDISNVYDNDIINDYDLHILDMKSVEEARKLVIEKYGHWHMDYGSFPFFERYVTRHLDAYIKSGKRPAKNTFMKYMDYELSPNSNDFHFGAPTPRHKDNEIWIGGAPVILVSLDEEILKDEGLL